jgi:hypothetical protein
MQRGCVFLVEQITKAEEMYRELSKLLPGGKVAIWTKDHDTKHVRPDAKVLNPAARFHVDALENYEVIVVTHAFFKGVRGHKAKSYVAKDGTRSPRALTVVDEQSNDVEVIDITLTDASKVLEAVQNDEKMSTVAAKPLHTVVKFMAQNAESPRTLLKPSDSPEKWHAVGTELSWFATPEAEQFLRHHKAVPGLEQVFKFAAAISGTRAFIARGSEQRFVGYYTGLMLTHGMVLLDATSDIDGLTPLCPWRAHVAVPQASYKNLDIIHVPSYTRQNLSRFLKAGAQNQFAYADWMKATIIEHTEPGEKVLVVCKKLLVDNRRVPFWPERDPLFDTPEVYTTKFGWELEGRKLCVTYWGGNGIGVNAWREADSVFLFDSHHIPKRAAIARAQGLMDFKSTEGPLAKMKGLRSRSPEVDALYEGHLLRHTKQMALRGNARNFNEHGECSTQRLVYTGDYGLLITNAQSLFPGARVTKVKTNTETSYAEKFIEALSRPETSACITTHQLSELVGAPWRSWGKDVLKRPETKSFMGAHGWRYMPKKGRGGGRIVRDPERGHTTTNSGNLKGDTQQLIGGSSGRPETGLCNSQLTTV